MALADIGRMIDVLRRVDRLFETVQKLQIGHEALGDRLLDLEKRVWTLENREELLIEKMGVRASEAATAVMNQNLMDMARRIGALEERMRNLGGGDQKRLE
jgi:uncharacterized protein (DUF2164 family)